MSPPSLIDVSRASRSNPPKASRGLISDLRTYAFLLLEPDPVALLAFPVVRASIDDQELHGSGGGLTGCREAIEVLTHVPKKVSYDVNKDGVKVADNDDYDPDCDSEYESRDSDRDRKPRRRGNGHRYETSRNRDPRRDHSPRRRERPRDRDPRERDPYCSRDPREHDDPRDRGSQAHDYCRGYDRHDRKHSRDQSPQREPSTPAV